MKVKGLIKDLTGVNRINKALKKSYLDADDKEIPFDNITDIASKLHPGKFTAKVVKIINETSDSKRIRLESEKIPLFKAGQYLTIELNYQSSIITRPYSIVTSPLEAYKHKYVEIIVKDNDLGVMATYLNHNLKVGDELLIEVGLGFFYYEMFRDHKNLTFIAGGAGITPFLSLLKDIKERNLDLNVSLIYGSDNPNEIIGYQELETLKNDHIFITYVISGNYPDFKGEKGFINEEIIKKYALKDSSYFICGPLKMYRFVLASLEKLGVDIRKVRHEPFALNNVNDLPDYPMDNKDKIYHIEVHQGKDVRNIEARGDESLLTALERNGYRIHSSCRSGECGFCRLKIIKGEYYIPQGYDHRRMSDKEYHYVHSCSAYPLSDLIIKINIL